MGLGEYTLAFVLASLWVAGATEATKRTVWIVLDAIGVDHPPWLRHLWRLSAVLWGVFGAACVANSSEIMSMAEGVSLGAGAGVLSASVVYAVKKKIRRQGDD
tara:strand:- start:319 stop:627 length:309 start_codon:yes stop_codon:yes gene_type:complete